MTASPGLPLQCTNPACGHVFTDSYGIGFGPNVVPTIEKLHFEHSCPRCGGNAVAGDGRYWVGQDGLMTLLDGPEWSFAMTDRLRAAFKVAAEDPARDGVAVIREVSPEVAQAIEEAVERGVANASVEERPSRRRALATGVIGLLWALVFADFSVGVDNLAALRDAILAVLSWVAQYGTLPPTG